MLKSTNHLFLCSRMAPHGMEDIRSHLNSLFGPRGSESVRHTLYVEYFDELANNEDVRPPCARSLRECDGVIVILDGGTSSARTPFESTTLEMEVMLAAVNGKPIWVVDVSGGKDSLYGLLKSEFLDGSSQSPVIQSEGISASQDRRQRVIEHVQAICQGDAEHGTTLDTGLGWQNLYLARRDSSAFSIEDGRYFPFGHSGMNVTDFDPTEIRKQLDLAEAAYKTDQIVSIVHSWDAIRGLSQRPWRGSSVDKVTALLWLRAWHFWGGSMSWLGLFGHCNAAAVMVNRSACDLAKRYDLTETRSGGPFGLDKHLGGLASSYFSLARQAPDATVSAGARDRGIDYCNKALAIAADPRSQAGLLAVRGPLRLLAGAKGFTGLADLHLAEHKHLRAAKGKADDGGLAAARVQIGAAYKEIGRRIPASASITLRIAENYLRRAVESLDNALQEDPRSNGGQLIMGMKHLVEAKYLKGERTAAYELWVIAKQRASEMELADQLRQLGQIGDKWEWEDSHSI